jgi:hypothetical protein
MTKEYLQELANLYDLTYVRNNYTILFIVLTWYITYRSVLYLSQKTTVVQPEKFTKHVISLIHTYLAIYGMNINYSISYYLYDIIHLEKNDIIFIAHHIVTLVLLYFKFNCEEKLMLGFRLMKLGDAFMYFTPVLSRIKLQKNICILCNMISIVCMFQYRIYYPFYLYPFDNSLVTVLAISLHLMNAVYLIYLMCKVGNVTLSH